MASFTRIFTVSALAACVGLIAARIPSLGEVTPSFSWPGLWVGIVLVAFFLSRVFIAGAEAHAQRGTPLQHFLLRVATTCFLATLLLFVAILYTQWIWPRFALPIAVGCGALSVLLGVVIAAFHRGD